MKLNKKLVSACLLSNFVIGNVPLAAMASSEITKNTGNFKTETDILNTGNVYNIKTETSVKGGTIGINSFDKFNVGKGDIVNLNLINSQNKLVNLIFDNSPSQINGIVRVEKLEEMFFLPILMVLLLDKAVYLMSAL